MKMSTIHSNAHRDTNTYLLSTESRTDRLELLDLYSLELYTRTLMDRIHNREVDLTNEKQTTQE